MSNPAQAHGDYRPDIDGLRAIAVLSVVLFHAAPQKLQGGFIGVDVFFVISGYLISTILLKGMERGDFSYRTFYSRRIRRLFPSLFTVLLTTFLLGWVLLLPSEFEQLCKHIVGSVSFANNLVLLKESGYFDGDAITKPLLHLWSLGIEEQFYIFCPPLLWLCFNTRLRVLPTLIAMTLLSFALNIFSLKFYQNGSIAFYSPHTRFWELLIGSLLAYMTLKKNVFFTPGPATLRTNLQSVAGLVMITIGIFKINHSMAFPGWLALLPVIGAALIIASGPQAWVNRYILSNRAMIWVGLLSYPLYLWHWPLLSYLAIVGKQWDTQKMRYLAVMISLGLSWLTYRWVEKPMRFGGGAFRTVALATVTASIGLLGLFYYLNDGYRSWPPTNTLAEQPQDGTTLFLRNFFLNRRYWKELGEARDSGMRDIVCHFNIDNPVKFEDFEKGIGKCLALDRGKPNILIVGDSTAGDFYSGLSRHHPEINFLQATGSSCTPVRKKLETVRPECIKLINYAIQFAKNNRLDGVILSAHWDDRFQDLLSEIDEFKPYVKTIYLAGPPLEFTTAVGIRLARQTMNQFIGLEKKIQNYQESFQQYHSEATWQRNEKMRKFSQDHGLQFIDRIRAFCADRSNCRLISETGQLYLIDTFHLTRDGTDHLARQVTLRR